MSARRSGRLVIIAVCLMVVCTCRTGTTKLSDEETKLSARIEFPETVLAEIKKSGTNLRQLSTVDDGGQGILAAGVTIDVSQEEAVAAVEHLRERLGYGYLVFISERHFGFEPDNVSVLRGTDQYEMLRVMQTNGWNYDISPETVIERVKLWDSRYGLDIYGAAFDWLEARFERAPADMMAFAREVYEFCPDVVDQGTETVEALANEMARTNSVYLWWD